MLRKPTIIIKKIGNYVISLANQDDKQANTICSGLIKILKRESENSGDIIFLHHLQLIESDIVRDMYAV